MRSGDGKPGGRGAVLAGEDIGREEDEDGQYGGQHEVAGRSLGEGVAYELEALEGGVILENRPEPISSKTI